MHGIARGHFVSTPLEYAFDHEVSSLSYIIWRLFRQHRFGFAASILAWSTWSRRNGLATIGGTVWYSKVQVKALSVYSHSMASLLPSRHSSCAQFSVPPRAECRQVTPCRASSASGTKAGTTSKTFFKLRGIEFSFQRTWRAVFGPSISPKTPVLKLNRPFARKPPASTASESARAAFMLVEKPTLLLSVKPFFGYSALGETRACCRTYSV